MALLELFPSVSPWNVYDLRLDHYLALTRSIDQRRAEAANRG